jgi:hypothetical protein
VIAEFACEFGRELFFGREVELVAGGEDGLLALGEGVEGTGFRGGDFEEKTIVRPREIGGEVVWFKSFRRELARVYIFGFE